MTLAVRGPDNSSGWHSTAYEEKEMVDGAAGYASRRIGSSRADSWGLWMARQRSDVVSACRAPGAFTVRIISLY
jgi:hypothetical protein